MMIVVAAVVGPAEASTRRGAESSNPPEPVIRLVAEMQLDGWAGC